MEFNDLLDEDGQGSRRCDVWLAENIANIYDEENVLGYDDANHDKIETPQYTTGDSFKKIWELAKEYLTSVSISWRHGKAIVDYKIDGPQISTDYMKAEEVALAKALFQAYHKIEG